MNKKAGIRNYYLKKHETNETINKSVLLNSTIGLRNAGGSCYMASIVQILIHLEKFLDYFNIYKNTNELCKYFYKFLKDVESAESSNKKYDRVIEIKPLSNRYHNINSKFKGTKGNNPMTFFIEFINDLNKDILSLFKGKKQIQFNGNKRIEEEDFIFYMITLDEENAHINEQLVNDNTKEFENIKDCTITEKIKKCPEILIINLEIDNIPYEGEDILMLLEPEMNYRLKAINKYDNVHSIAYIKIDEEWCEFDDSNCYSIDFDNIFDNNSRSNHIYNLFYESYEEEEEQQK